MTFWSKKDIKLKSFNVTYYFKNLVSWGSKFKSWRCSVPSHRICSRHLYFRHLNSWITSKTLIYSPLKAHKLYKEISFYSRDKQESKISYFLVRTLIILTSNPHSTNFSRSSNRKIRQNKTKLNFIGQHLSKVSMIMKLTSIPWYLFRILMKKEEDNWGMLTM